MKKVSACTLMAGVVAIATAGQANAANYSANTQKAQQLRASANALNQQAGRVEYQIRCLRAQGRHAPHLRQQARKMRHKAITLAKMSNRLMRSNFGGQQQRPRQAHRVVHHRPVQRVIRHVVHHRPVHRAAPAQRVVYHAPQPIQRVHYQQPQRVIRYAESDGDRSTRVLQNIIQPVLGLAIHRLRDKAQRRHMRRSMRQHRRHASHRSHRRGRHSNREYHQNRSQDRHQQRMHGGGKRMMQHSMQASYRHGQKHH